MWRYRLLGKYSASLAAWIGVVSLFGSQTKLNLTIILISSWINSSAFIAADPVIPAMKNFIHKIHVNEMSTIQNKYIWLTAKLYKPLESSEFGLWK